MALEVDAVARESLRPLGLLVCIALVVGLPAVVRAEAVGSAAAVVYGIELETVGERDRLLVFARGPIAFETQGRSEQTLELRIPDAVLDATATRRIQPDPGSALRIVTAEDAADPARPNRAAVRIVVEHEPGLTPTASQRGSIVALEWPRPKAPEGRLLLGRRDVELADLVREVAALSGRRFLFDEELRGRVHLLGAGALDADAALELLHAALLLGGYAALPGPAGVDRIVRILEGPSGATAVARAIEGADGGLVTLVVRLRAADPQSVVAALRPHTGSSGIALPHEPSASVILAGPAARVGRWQRIAERLDDAAEETLWVQPARHRAAGELGALLGGLEARAAAPAAFFPDERTGRVVVRARPDRRPLIERRFARLDVPESGTGTLRVLRVFHVDPAPLAEHLRGLEELTARDVVVAVDRATSSLVVQADPSGQALVAELVSRLDQPPPRIEVEVVVMEVTTGDRLALGFDAFVPLTTPKSPSDLVAFALSDPTGSLLSGPSPARGLARFAREPLVIPLVNAAGVPVSAVVPRDVYQMTADAQWVQSRVLMRPRILATTGESHELFAGEQVPVPTAAADDPGADPLAIRTRVDRQDVGLRLRVRPTLGRGDAVRLELELDLTQVSPSLVGRVEQVGPTLRQRRLSTTVWLEGGELVVVGTGPERVSRAADRGIPYWKDIPALGWLFRAERQVQGTRELVVAASARRVGTGG